MGRVVATISDFSRGTLKKEFEFTTPSEEQRGIKECVNMHRTPQGTLKRRYGVKEVQEFPDNFFNGERPVSRFSDGGKRNLFIPTKDFFILLSTDAQPTIISRTSKEVPRKSPFRLLKDPATEFLFRRISYLYSFTTVDDVIYVATDFGVVYWDLIRGNDIASPDSTYTDVITVVNRKTITVGRTETNAPLSALMAAPYINKLNFLSAFQFSGVFDEDTGGFFSFAIRRNFGETLKGLTASRAFSLTMEHPDGEGVTYLLYFKYIRGNNYELQDCYSNIDNKFLALGSYEDVADRPFLMGEFCDLLYPPEDNESDSDRNIRWSKAAVYIGDACSRQEIIREHPDLAPKILLTYEGRLIQCDFIGVELFGLINDEPSNSLITISNKRASLSSRKETEFLPRAHIFNFDELQSIKANSPLRGDIQELDFDGDERFITANATDKLNIFTTRGLFYSEGTTFDGVNTVPFNTAYIKDLSFNFNSVSSISYTQHANIVTFDRRIFVIEYSRELLKSIITPIADHCFIPKPIVSNLFQAPDNLLYCLHDDGSVGVVYIDLIAKSVGYFSYELPAGAEYKVRSLEYVDGRVAFITDKYILDPTRKEQFIDHYKEHATGDNIALKAGQSIYNKSGSLLANTLIDTSVSYNEPTVSGFSYLSSAEFFRPHHTRTGTEGNVENSVFSIRLYPRHLILAYINTDTYTTSENTEYNARKDIKKSPTRDSVDELQTTGRVVKTEGQNRLEIVAVHIISDTGQ